MTGRQVPAAEVNHAAYEHEQLKQWTDDADASSSQAFADEWTQSGVALMEAADTLKRASAESEAGWTGEAADAMRARLGQIYQWSSRTGTQIANASQGVGRQSEAADAAHRSMPDPVPYDPVGMIRDAQRGGLIDMATLPQRMVAQKEAHDAAHAEAVRVVAERDSALSAAAGEVELFEPPPALDESSEAERTFVGARDVNGPGGPGALPAPRQAGESGPGPGPSGSAGSGSAGSGSPSGGPVPAGVAPAAALPAAGPQTSGDGVGTAPSPGSTSPESFASREPAGTAFGPTPIPQQGGGSSSGFGSGPVPGGGSGAGVGVLGGAPAGGRGVGAGLPGVSPGPAAAEAATARAGARGGGALGGMPIGGGAARDEDDAEHQRPEFLQEPDPDGIFDTDVLTAPSVIGGSDEE